MGTRKKILILIVVVLAGLIVSVMIGGFCFLYIQSVDRVAEQSLDPDLYRLNFSYSNHSGYDKTPNPSKPEKINLNYYKKSDFVDYLYDCSIFPDGLSCGEAKMLLFIDPVFINSAVKRGEVYLEWSVNKDVYEQEIKRIGEIEGRQNRHPLWSTNLFMYPSYVSKYNWLSSFEYALFDEKAYTIRYIKFVDMDSVDNLNFSLSFAPTNVLLLSDIYGENTINGEYSIY